MLLWLLLSHIADIVKVIGVIISAILGNIFTVILGVIFTSVNGLIYLECYNGYLTIFQVEVLLKYVPIRPHFQLMRS